MAWNPADLPDLTGRTAIVTGANSGIGWHAAAELARHGAAVTLACRRLPEAGQAADRIRALAPGAEVSVRRLDLASLDSVAEFAQAWTGPLHLLVNNAGVMAPRTWQATADGFERQFGTNHLGHFALTARLLPALLAAPAPRVVTVSSIAHRGGTAAVLLGNPAEGYRAQAAYSNSKLANLLFGLELQRQATRHESPLTSTVAHPGVASTNLLLSPDGMGANPVIRAFGATLGRLLLAPAASGANPTLYAATVATPGSYTGPQWLNGVRGPVGPATASPVALDVGLAEQLWDLSEELTGVSFSWPVVIGQDAAPR